LKYFEFYLNRAGSTGQPHSLSLFSSPAERRVSPPSRLRRSRAAVASASSPVLPPRSSALPSLFLSPGAVRSPSSSLPLLLLASTPRCVVRCPKPPPSWLAAAPHISASPVSFSPRRPELTAAPSSDEIDRFVARVPPLPELDDAAARLLLPASPPPAVRQYPSEPSAATPFLRSVSCLPPSEPLR
jgi:hypothetical protein